MIFPSVSVAFASFFESVLEPTVPLSFAPRAQLIFFAGAKATCDMMMKAVEDKDIEAITKIVLEIKGFENSLVRRPENVKPS